LVCRIVDGKEVRHFLLQRGGRLFRCIEVWATCNHDTTRCEKQNNAISSRWTVNQTGELLSLVFGAFETETYCERIEIHRFPEFCGADEILNSELLVIGGRNHPALGEEFEKAFSYCVGFSL
jgi:hypothetical protein